MVQDYHLTLWDGRTANTRIKRVWECGTAYKQYDMSTAIEKLGAGQISGGKGRDRPYLTNIAIQKTKIYSEKNISQNFTPK